MNFEGLSVRDKAQMFSRFCAGLIWYAELDGKEYWFREAGQYMVWRVELPLDQKSRVKATAFQGGKEFAWNPMGRRRSA